MTITEAYQQMHSLLLRIRWSYYQTMFVVLDGAAAIGFGEGKRRDTASADRLVLDRIAVNWNDHFFIAKYGFLDNSRNVNTPWRFFRSKLNRRSFQSVSTYFILIDKKIGIVAGGKGVQK